MPLTKKRHKAPSQPSNAGRATEVLYTRLPRETYEKIVEIAAKRGWPHTTASVAAELIAKGLAS